MMKDHVFGNMTTTSTFGNPESFRIVKLEGKGKGKGGFKRIGNAYLGEEQTHDNDWWSEEGSVWWSKGKKGKKGFSKGKN